MADMTLEDWHQQQFLPWKQAVAKVLEQRQSERALFQQHVGQLQSILALLLEGRNRQAVLAWNTLHLKPMLADIRLQAENNQVTLLPMDGGDVIKMNLDDVIADLQGLLDGRAISNPL